MRLKPGDHRKECCRKSENLEFVRKRPDLVKYTCKVCGCRHFELTADPGKLSVKVIG